MRLQYRLQRDVNERDILLERMEKMKIAPSAHGNGAAADPEESAAKKVNVPFSGQDSHALYFRKLSRQCRSRFHQRF